MKRIPWGDFSVFFGYKVLQSIDKVSYKMILLIENMKNKQVSI